MILCNRQEINIFGHFYQMKYSVGCSVGTRVAKINHRVVGLKPRAPFSYTKMFRMTYAENFKIRSKFVISLFIQQHILCIFHGSFNF